jgi:hypothetical protein
MAGPFSDWMKSETSAQPLVAPETVAVPTPAPADPAEPRANTLTTWLNERPDPSLAIDAALGTNADEAAKQRKIAQQTGLPVEAVEASPQQAERVARKNQVTEWLTDAPATATFLSDPQNAKIAHDDVESLTGFERLARSFQRGQLQHEQGTLGSRLRDTRSPEVLERIEANRARLKELGRDEDGVLGWIGSAAEVLGQQYASLSSPKLAIRVGGGGAIGAAVGAAGGPLAPVTSAVGAVTGMGAGFLSHLAVDSFEVEGGNAYLESLELGVDPDVAKWTSLGVGTLNAALEVGAAAVVLKPLAEGTRELLKLSVKDAMKAPAIKAAAKKLAVAYGTGIAAEVSTEMMQEAVQIAGEEIGKTFTDEYIAAATPEEIKERMEEIAVKTFKAMTVLGLPGPAMNFATDAKNARMAAKDKETLDELNKLATESKLAQRDPEKAAEHQANALDQAGVSEVYIPADAINEFAATKGQDGGDVYKNLGIEDQIEEATATGGDVRISGEKFARHLLNTEDYAALADHIRMDPNGMTPAEAEEFEKSGLKDAVARMEAGEPGGLAEVSDDVKKQLTDAGFTSKEIEGMTPAEAEELVKPLSESQKELPDAQQAKRGVTLAEDQLGLQGLFTTAEEAGMSEAQYKTYLEAVDAAKAQGELRQQEKVLKERQRELTAEWKAELEEVRQSVAESVNQEPVYAAFNAIGRDRLNQEAVVELIGEQGLELLPKQSGGRSIVSPKGFKGVHPDTLAQLYGFDDGVDLLNAFLDARPINEVIDEKANEAMRQQHGTLLDEKQAVSAALNSLHTNQQAKVLELELTQLRKARGEGRLKASLLRQAARERLKQYKIEDIRPDKFLSAERREALKAGKLLRAGDRAGAAQAKFRQLLNFQFAQEAYAVREQIDNEHRFLMKFLRARKAWRSLPADYLEQIREILTDYQLGPRLSDKKRKSLEAWAFAKATEEGSAIGSVIKEHPRVVSENTKAAYQELTLSDWSEVVDTVKELYHYGVSQNKLLLETEKRQREEIVAGIVEQVQANLGTNKRVVESRTTWQQAKRYGREALATLLNADTMLREVDGFKDLGPAYNAIKGGYDRAYTEGYQPGQIGYLKRQRQEAKALLKLFEVYSKKERGEMGKLQSIPGLSVKLSRQGVVAVLLNSGNADNIAAMVDSGQFTADEVKAIQRFASKKDWDFAQSVWDYLDSFWPEVKTAMKRRRGTVAERVDAQAVETSHGTYKGGYYPLRYDNQQSIVTNAQDTSSLLENARFGSFVAGHTKRHHTEERVGGGGRKVLLDLFVLNSHVDQVIYDLEVGDAVTDAYKILHNKELKRSFENAGRIETWEALDLWLGDVITGEMRSSYWWEAGARWLRTGFTISKLGWNVSTALLQPLGILQTSVVIGSKATWAGVWHTLSGKQTGENSIYNFVVSQSGFMAQREDSFNKDIVDAQRQLNQSLASRVLPGSSAEFISASMFFMLKKTQRLVDTMTWLGARQKGMELFDDDAKAIEYADRMVARAQSSGNFGERTQFERGTMTNKVRQTELVRMWTPLISYFMAKTNVAYEQTKKTNFRKPGEVVGWATDMAMLYTVEAIFVGLIKGQWPDPDDEEEGWVSYAGWETIKSIFAGVPFAREFISEADGFRGGGVSGAVLGTFDKFLDQAKQGEVDAALLKNANNLAGIFLKYPSSQINKTGEAVYRALDGEDVSPVEFFMGPNFNK